MAELRTASRKYLKQTVEIVFGLFLLELLAYQLFNAEVRLTPILVSMCFALVVEISDACLWRRIGDKADETKAHRTAPAHAKHRQQDMEL